MNAVYILNLVIRNTGENDATKRNDNNESVPDLNANEETLGMNLLTCMSFSLF